MGLPLNPTEQLAYLKNVIGTRLRKGEVYNIEPIQRWAQK